MLAMCCYDVNFTPLEGELLLLTLPANGEAMAVSLLYADVALKCRLFQ